MMYKNSRCALRRRAANTNQPDENRLTFNRPTCYSRLADITCTTKLTNTVDRGRGTRLWRQILDRKWKYSCFVHAPCIRPYLQEQFVHCGRGYGADTTFHRTYFSFLAYICKWFAAAKPSITRYLCMFVFGISKLLHLD